MDRDKRWGRIKVLNSAALSSDHHNEGIHIDYNEELSMGTALRETDGILHPSTSLTLLTTDTMKTPKELEKLKEVGSSK